MLHHTAIASTKARFIWPSGEMRLVGIEVGAPILSANGDWRCELDLNGIEGEVTAMIGEDSLSALSSALYFIRLRIERYRSAGVRVLYSSADEDLLLDCLFPHGLAVPNAPKG